jgi:hypothetical protein
MPMPLNIGTSRALLGQANADAAWLALLQSSATYAWDGVQGLSLASWVDVVAGVSAAATGSGSATLDTYNGRPAVLLPGGAGGRRYRTAQLTTIAQPFVVVFACGGTTSQANQGAFDGFIIDTTLLYQAPAGAARLYNGASGPSIANVMTLPSVFLCIFNGASSSLSRNGGAAVTANAGTGQWDGATIGGRVLSDPSYNGKVMHYSIYAGDKLANAATVAAAAQIYYGIS